jgi:hypothetical protein
MQHWVDELLASTGQLTTWIVLHHVAQAPSPGLSQKELAGAMAVGGLRSCATSIGSRRPASCAAARPTTAG